MTFEEYFRTMMKQSPIAIQIMTTDGRIVLVNDAYEKLWEITLEDLSEYNILKDKQAKRLGLMPYIKRGFAGETLYLPPFEYDPYKTVKRGRKRWIQSNMYSIKDKNGQIRNVIMMQEDITDRKKAEEEVKAQKKFTDNIINSLADTIYIIDPKSGKGIYWNETLNKISGYNYKQMNEYPPAHFYPPEEHKLIEEVVETTLKRGRGSVELNYIIADGSRIPFEYKLALIKGAEGKSCICVVGRDLREQKKTDERLASSERFLNSVIEQNPTSLWISDSEGTLIKMNQSCRELFGATEEETVGKYNLFKDNLIEEQGFIPLVENVFEKGEIARFTIDYDLPRVEHVKIKGATHRILNVIIAPIKDMHGKITNAIVQHKDITERKKAEEKLQEYSERLEELIEERTRELKDAHKQLLKVERLATIGELASSIAHELRNPLGVINNSSFFLNMKLKNVADEKVLKHLGIIAKKVNSANIIISNLLDFARKIKPTLKETKINFIVNNALSSINIPENIEVITKLGKIPLTLLDCEQFQRVFQNMILNAVQAMPEGGKLTIKTVKRSDMIIITFKDTGVGISEENFGKIFEPLFSTKAKGIGLGLSICKQIVGNHDGNITVQSEVSKGSTFTVKFPLHIEGEIDR